MHTHPLGDPVGADAGALGNLSGTAARGGWRVGAVPWEYTLPELFRDLGYRTACFGK